MSWQQLRTLTEKFAYVVNGIRTIGFNPPGGKDGKDVERVPYHVKYVTSKGHLESGYVVTLKVFPAIHQRMVQFVDSRQIRRIRDYLVIEIDGIRIVTH